MLSLLNQSVEEYSVVFTVGDTGIQTLTYSSKPEASYLARLETVTRELVERQYGLKENVQYRMYSIVAPILGRCIKIDNVYYRIVLVVPMVGKSAIHHYESLLAK